MSIKKYSNGAWSEVGYKKYGTETDTITTLPKTIIGDGQPISAYTIKGNMAQSSQPTPTNPIYPTECADKTANLLNVDSWYGDYKQPDGTYKATRSQLYAIKIKPFTSDDIGKTFTFAMDIAPVSGNVRVTANNGGTVTNGDSAARSVVTFTVATVDDTIYFNYGSFGDTITTISNIMLNTGSTSLPYEPYGYKIPISSGGVTTNVYLGEVETTRSIIKRAFTGSEIWYYGDSIFTWLTTGVVPGAGLCSHFSYGSPSTDGNFNIILNAQQYIAFQFRYTSITSLSDFKQWLADQYAAGTPVTVFYRRSTPLETTSNEPLMKIGNYADSISMEQTGIEIPTINGSNTFDVDTTLKPSEVQLTYHGWHEHSDTKFTT